MSEEKTFKHYEEFPPEVRMEVINEMQPIERVRFTRCSKLSQKETRKSKNYLRELQIELPLTDERVAIGVFHKKYNDYERDPDGYEMVFKEEEGQKYISFQLRYGRRDLYRVQLNESVDLVEYAKEHFKSLLQMYQNTIKSLYISETNNFDYGITSLKNLESLSLYKNSDVLPFLSIIRHPLKSLYFQDTVNHEIITAGDQIYQVKDTLDAKLLRMNYEQFKRLNAKYIIVGTWELTPQDLYDFIKSWKSGTIRDTFQRCCWCSADTDFDKDELFRLLGLENNGRNLQDFEIKHDTVAGRNAELVFFNNDIIFLVLANRAP